MPPFVSIIIPCYNEQTTIGKLLEALAAQTYPHARMEVVIADGMSTDGTRQVIAEFARSHNDLRPIIVDNPKRIIPAGLNRALEKAKGEVIIRLDAHSQPYPDYVTRCLADLEEGLGDNVGGMWDIHPGDETWIAVSIAAAAAHPLGAGDAMYRRPKKAAEVDTVPFGAFKRELLALVGFFNENLLTNEDYEFNARVRARGGRIWLDPSIRSIYYARSTFAALGKQYFRYGYWKWRMLKNYPGTLRYRQALPPAFAASLVFGFAAALFLPIFRIIIALEILVYAFVLAACGLLAAFHLKKPFLALGLPLAISIMHIAWGTGFLWSMINGIFLPGAATRK